MTRTSFAFSNFTAGQLSDRLTGRVDLSKYKNGCSELTNFVVHPHGGATRRPGTEYVAPVKTHSLKTRLFGFEFNQEQTYIIEAGNQYFRFYKDDGQILDSGSPYEISTPYLTAELFSLRFAQSADTMYIVHNNHAPRKLTRTGHTNWTLTEVDFEYGPMQDINTTTTTITASGRTGSITLTASANLFAATDVGRLVKIYEGWAKITAFTNATTVTATVQKNLKGDAELLPEYTSDTISFVEGDPDSTGSEHNDRIVDTNKDFVNQNFQVGQKITVSSSSSNNGTYLIVSVTADTILTGPSDDLANESAGSNKTIVGTLEATDEWRLGAFSETTGFPAAVCFYEERLVYAGTNEQPQTIFFSESGGFDQFNTGAETADAMIYTIASSTVDFIRYLAPGRSLVCGTSGGEFVVTSGTTADPISPTNIQIKKQASYGTADVQPVNAGNATLFLQRAKRKVRELSYSFDVDGYVAPDLTLLAEDVSESGIDDMALQQEPDNIVWAVRGDGVLIGMTYRREEDVVAWHQHILGGYSDTGKNIIAQAISFTANSTTVNVTNDTITLTSHGLSTGDQVYYDADSNVIGGLLTSIPYFVIATDSNTIKLATTSALASAGTAIDLTSAPSSDTTQKIVQGVNIKNNILFSSAHGFTTGDIVYYDTGGTAIGGLAENQKYYVQRIDENQIKFSTTQDFTNDIVDLTSAPAAEQTDNIFTHAVVETVAVIPGDLNEDQLWMIVKRTINGSEVRYVEYLTDIDFGRDPSNAFYVDSGLTYTGTAATTISGLDHIEGSVVAINANGAAVTNKTVSSNAITLDSSVTKAHIGLPYDSVLTTMRMESLAADGTSQGKIKRIHDVTARLYRTIGAKIGDSKTSTDLVPFRSSAAPMNSPLQLFTGDKTIEFTGGYDTDGFVTIVQDQPMPMTVIALYARLETFDK